MIRGINHMTVEINSTDSPYFERAICFVRPQYTNSERLDLHKAACRLVDELDLQIEAKPPQEQRKTGRAVKWITTAAAGVLGLAAGALLSVII